MLRLLALLATLLAVAAPASAAERRYPVADFERIVIEGPYQVRLAVGRPGSASASGSNRALDAVSIEVQSGTLRIRPRRDAWSAAPGSDAPAIVTLGTRSLRAARILGAGRLDLTGARGLRIDLIVDGGGRLTASGLAADSLSLGLRGSGSLIVAGSAKQLAVDVQGAGSLDGAALSADDATITAATTGEIRLAVRRTATINANGLGPVIITGNAECIVRGAAAATVSCGRVR